jgi:hypothetical protein
LRRWDSVTSDETNKDLTCDVADKPENAGETANGGRESGANERPGTSMTKDEAQGNSSDVEELSIQIADVDVDDPEDVDPEDVDAIEERIEEIEAIDFRDLSPPQRDLLEFELSTLQAMLEAISQALGMDSHKSIEGGEDDE